MEDSKKKEYATYNALGLKRTAKSRRRRDFVGEQGIHLFVGGREPERPAMKVLKKTFESVWQEVLEDCRNRCPRDMAFEKWQDHERVRIEREVYDRLLEMAHGLENLARSFEQKHGRKMTPYEMERFEAAMEHVPADEDSRKKRNDARADMVRRRWVGGVMDKIRKNQDQRPGRLQQAWASLVGTEAAMDSNLEKVDPVKGLAYCRCLSSVRRFELQRKTDLPKRLGKALGMNIRKIVFR